MKKQLLVFFTLFCLSNLVLAQCPSIDVAMINSCGATEGINEFVAFTTTNAVAVSSYKLYLGTANPPTTTPSYTLSGAGARAQNGAGSIVASGCTITYVTSPSTIIPSGSRVIFIPSDFVQAYDLSSLCSGGGLYVVFIDRANSTPVWTTSGNFGNFPSTNRYLQLVNGANNCSSNVRGYKGDWTGGDKDGNFVSWDATGRATYGNNGCSFNALPTITPSPIAAICAGTTTATMAFTTTGTPKTYSLTWNAAALTAGFVNVAGTTTLPATPLSIAVPIGAAAATYTASLIVADSVPTSSTPQDITVTIKATPAAPSVISPLTYCQNKIASALTTSTGSGLLWYTVATNGTGSATAITPSTAVAGSNNYYVSQTVLGCESPRAMINVVTNPTPTVPVISVTQPTCIASGSLTVTSPIDASLTYSLDNITFQSSPIFATGISAGNYTITVKNSSGCTASSTTTVDAVPLAPASPVVTITKPTCTVATGTIDVTPVVGLTYSIDGVNFSNTTNFPNLLPNGYIITAKNGSGCIASSNASITTAPTTPSAPVVATSNLCKSSTALPLTATGTGLLWYVNATGGTGATTAPTPLTTVTTPTIYYVSQTADGCESPRAALTVNILATTTSATAASICPGSSYTFNGTSYTAAGTYNATLTNASGCDSVATLNLTLKATSSSTTNVGICPGGAYLFNGTNYTVAGNYTKTLTNAAGCDSIAILNLTLKATSSSTTNASICPGGAYLFNGTSYAIAGNYSKTLINAAGCDSIATLILTIKATSTSITNANVCAGLSYSFNGTSYTVGGIYVAHLSNAVGCDSAATLNLTIKAKSSSTTNVSICPGGAYIFNGTSYTIVGNYNKTLTNAAGCDSIATLNLTLKATSSSTTNASICPGGAYVFNGTNYTVAGNYSKTLTNAAGCDSTATLNLTIKQKTTSTTNASICSGKSYLFNGISYTKAGTYISNLVNAAGCDSTATLQLSVNSFNLSLTTNPNPVNGGYNFTALITGDAPIASSTWTPSNLFINNQSAQNTTAPFNNFTLQVIAASNKGCLDTVTQLINVINLKDIVYIPNAFSPNASGNQDITTLKVYGTTIKSATMLVFNQWGQKIFESNKPTVVGWNGSSNGKAQPSGVYVYSVKITFFNNKTETRSGAINLIR